MTFVFAKKLFNFLPKICVNNFKVYFSANLGAAIKESKIHVDGIDINCVQVGSGEHPVLLLPGILGSAWTDFKPQIENLSRDKFKIVAWDPPGFGKSRPPDQTFQENFYERDATLAFNLMKTLGHSSFSLIGWSYGGTVSLILASKFSKNIRKMLLIGTISCISPEEVHYYPTIRNINTWSANAKDQFIALYGEQYFQNTWSKWIDVMLKLYYKNEGNICNHFLADIQCPTLIVHGNKDCMISPKSPLHLNKHINNSRIVYWDQGGHNLHLKNYEKFNTLATEFLTEK